MRFSMTLQLLGDESGLCHYLGSKRVRPGDVIEALINGEWIKMQYGWSGLAENNAFGIIDTDTTTVTLTDDTQVRWPQKGM
jgi:hypothetical protein